MRNVHLITVGRDTRRIKTGLRRLPADKVYLLHSPDFTQASDGKDNDFGQIAKRLRDDLVKGGYDAELVRIDAYSLTDVVRRIVEISKREKESDRRSQFWVNISGGTNLMAGAATAASYFIGATIYYVLGWKSDDDPLDEKVMTFPTPNMPDPDRIGESGVRLLKFMESWDYERNMGKLTNADIARELKWSPQTANHNVQVLKRWHLVDTEKGTVDARGKVNNREVNITLTDNGRLFATWLPD